MVHVPVVLVVADINRSGENTPVVRGDLQWSECWDLNDLGSLRGGGVEVPQNPGSLVLLDHF